LQGTQNPKTPKPQNPWQMKWYSYNIFDLLIK
jgi:hypothetical protein